MNCLPYPLIPWDPCVPCVPWTDPELDRLRRLQRMRQVEEEKARIREWLRQHGMPQKPVFPLPVWPPSRPALGPRCPPRATIPVPRDVSDVIGRIR